MTIAKETSEFRDNLAYLQTESLTVIALLSGVIGFIWLCLVVWPVTGEFAPISAWVGGGLLTLSAIISFLLKSRHLRMARHLLVWSISGAIAFAMFTFLSPAVAYLFILPIIFASVLLSQRATFLVATVASLTALAVGLMYLGRPFSLADVVLPVTTILLVSVAAWLSMRNLYTTLAWVWNGYENARRNEQMVREQQVELRRVLKALDESTFRLERANYQSALARDQAEEARRLKQQFAQTISHELRTPLNLIVGFTELMAQSPEYYEHQLSPAYLRDLSTVYRNACHLQSLVNDVLDLARIETAQMSLQPEEVDPSILVRETVEIVRSLVVARGLTLCVEVDAFLPKLWVDPIRIRQVLFNLINNAVRFTERGSVTIRVCQQGEEVIFAVADTGVGIAAKDIPRLFEEFQQVDGSTRRRHGGSGLGLAISRRFVDLHRGRIWVESQVAQGSTFYFSLPMSRIDPGDAINGRAMEVTRLAPVKWGEESILLAITDSPAAATLLTRYVRGCRTIVSHDLEQGRRVAQQLMPQVVVVDVTCGQLDAQKLEELVRDWNLPHTVFLICPLPGEESLRQRLRVDGYLIKPVSRQGLWDVLRQFEENVDHVLVIDDDHDFVRLLSRMLDNPIRRYRVTSAYSGQEGLALLRHRQPDLILLDLGLPDLDGVQIIDRIRSTPMWQHIPIVAVSAQDEIDNLEALTGAMVIAQAGGLKPGEVVRWIQHVLDTTMQTRSSLERA